VTKAWTHWGTSRHFSALRIPTHDAGTGLAGPALGRSIRGGAFVFDPFDAYGAGLVTNPNMVVVGSIGTGKSTIVKMMVDRALRRGRRVVIVDPKGEYAALALAHGVRPLVVGLDGWCWPSTSHERSDVEFITTLLSCAKGAALSDEEHFVLERTWDSSGPLRRERPLSALSSRLSAYLDDPLSSAERTLALSLRRFIDGDLAHLYDGEGHRLSFDAPLVVLDVSRYWGAESMALAALGAVAAAQGLASSDAPGYLVLDEAWALLSDEASLKWLQGSWKLARARGISHVLVLHRWTDVAVVGAEGSAARARARGLLRECETSWLFRQPPDEAAEMSAVLGLSQREERTLPELTRGVALVRYGRGRSLVRLLPDARDASFTDSDVAMRSARA
jgi:type IV secretory pathway VirB4 component